MLSRTLKTITIAAIAAGVFAGSASASVVDYDDVKLTSTGYDFGENGFAFGEPTNAGDLHFHHENGTIRPHLRGVIHLNDADGTCGRMRLEYFSSSGASLTTPKYGGEVCVNDDGHHKWSVDLDPWFNPSIASVRVSIQKETVNGWSTTDSATFGMDTHADDVKITEDGFDFGSTGWGLGVPSGDGTMTWSIASNGVVSPRLTGGIHINNSSGECARMNLRYLTEGGSFIDSKPGGTVCAPDNGHHVWSVNLAPTGSSQIGKVQVQLQTLASNGNWVTAGSQTVSINE